MVPTLSDKRVTVQILNDIDRQIERFLMVRATISLIVGLVVWGTFLLLGVDDAAVWGVVGAVLVAIPLVRPDLVLVLAAGVAAFLQFGTLSMTAAVSGACIAIGALEGNVLTPWLMSRVGEMNAAAVFVSLIFWGWIWGGWGLCSQCRSRRPSRPCATACRISRRSRSCSKSEVQGREGEWRKRLGVEPSLPGKRGAADFEDREGHRAPFASVTDSNR